MHEHSKCLLLNGSRLGRGHCRVGYRGPVRGGYAGRWRSRLFFRMRLTGAMGARTDLERRHGSKRLRAVRDQALGKSQDADAGAETLLGMGSLFPQNDLDERPSGVAADLTGLIDRGALVSSRHSAGGADGMCSCTVVCLRLEEERTWAATLTAMKDLDQPGVIRAQNRLAQQLVRAPSSSASRSRRDGSSPDPALLPFGKDIRLGRQSGFSAESAQTVPRRGVRRLAPEVPRHLRVIELRHRVRRPCVQCCEREELSIAQLGGDEASRNRNPNFGLGFVPGPIWPRRQNSKGITEPPSRRRCDLDPRLMEKGATGWRCAQKRRLSWKPSRFRNPAWQRQNARVREPTQSDKLVASRWLRHR